MYTAAKAFFGAVLILTFIIHSPAGWHGLPGVGTVWAQNDWKGEFEAVCAGTQEAAGMSRDELKNLVARCDRLRPLIEKLDETQRKVYLKRLKMCRDLYAFVLETKETQ